MKRYGETLAREVDQRILAPQATLAAIKAIPQADRDHGKLVMCSADGSLWRMDTASTATDASDNLVLTPSAGTGRWMRANQSFGMKFAVAFGSADAAVLFTVPVGFVLRLSRCYWEVTTAFTGGSSSAIGLSSSNAAYSTKGDLLGGASGDVLAGLTAGFKGTSGAKMGSASVVVLIAGDTVRFDRITSVFTAGAGFAHAAVDLLPA